MINELHQLSLAIKNANIEMKSWHRKYGEIPNISPQMPLYRVVLNQNRVLLVDSVSQEKKSHIRKFGNNQGSFPHMNLASLFLLDEKEQIDKLKKIKSIKAEEINLADIKELCIQNNWESKNFKKKYKNCFETIPSELEKMLNNAPFAPLNKLIEAAFPFKNSDHFHAALTEKAFEMIEAKKDVEVALNLLFYAKERKNTDSANQEATSDYGRLSIILDSSELEDMGYSTIGSDFTNGLNHALLSAEKNSQISSEEFDAFGKSYSKTTDPMPMINLAAGFSLSLRTMFKGQPNQYRYGKIENDTFPISIAKRNEIKDAFEYLSSKPLQNKTWIITGKDKDNKPDEVLFIYPNHFHNEIPGLINPFAQTNFEEADQSDFEAQAKFFIEYITETKEFDPEEYPDNIQIFMIKKLDKARSKVIYSRISSPDEIIRQSDIWQKAAKNLPIFYSGTAKIPFPIGISETMNRIWKQNGELSSDKFKPVKSYHGLEMLFGLTKKELEFDLQVLLRNCQKLAVYAGNYFNRYDHPDTQKNIFKIKSTIVLIGMLLFWLDQRKEKYMNEYPYLLGQLLKASDNLHELYCYRVRDGNIPPQLAGGSLYMSAAEFPSQAISQLAQRMMPYLNWAKTHQNERIEKTRRNPDGTESAYIGPSAGYYLHQYQNIANKLAQVISDKTRFSDFEKAGLFLGYLASFPKTSKDDVLESESD